MYDSLYDSLYDSFVVRYIHWMVTNIPNNNVKAGVEVMNYVPPFSLEFTEDGEFITDPVESGHPLILVVFKQNSGKILTDEAQRGCSKVICQA